MKYYFIVNPHSRSGRGKGIWKQLMPYLNLNKISWKAFFTQYPGHCTQIVRQLTENTAQPLTIVILGGDGTLNEAVNGLYQLELVTLAYIPSGSSNDFARGMQLSGTPISMLQNIIHKTHELQLDCGVVKAPGKVPKRFLVSSGTGFDAYVTDEALHSKIKKFLNKFGLGKLTYTCIAIKQLLTMPLQTATIILDDKKVLYRQRLYFAASHNLPYEGGGFKFAPKASPTDGVLDVCIIHSLPKLKALCLLPTAFFGKHIHFDGIEIQKCRKMKIFFEKPSPVHTDGETYHPRQEITVWCEPGIIHYVY